MAGTFDVGSILARVGFDTTQLKKNAATAVNAAKGLAKDVKRALGPQSQVDFIKARPVLNNLNKISRQVRRLARTVRTQLGKAFKQALLFPVRGPILAFRLLRRAGVGAARALRRSFGLVTVALQRIRRAVFGITGLFALFGATIGAISLIQRAQDVESLRGAFDNLTASVEGTADGFLKKLQVATRGVVSNMNLLRITNQAVLLGVVRSQDEFAELATIARRLGSAVGRDTVDALSDLSTGIGRQSRLILDNLGIIIKLGPANEAYARSLGKTVDQLTDAQKRTAFFNSTMDAARKKVLDLGEDLPSLADAVGKFTAQLSNTVTIFAQAFVGAGPFQAIGDFLEKNQNRIRAFANFLGGVISDIIGLVRGVLDDLLSSSGTIPQFFKELADFIAEAVEFLLVTVGNAIGLAIDIIFSKLGLAILKSVIAILGLIGNAVTDKIRDIIDDNVGAVLKKVNELAKALPFLFGLLGLAVSTSAGAAIDKELDRIEKDGKARLAARAGAENRAQKQILQLFKDSSREIGEEAEKLKDKVISEVQDADLINSGNRFFKAVGQGFDLVGDRVNEFRENFNKITEEGPIRPGKTAAQFLDPEAFGQILAPFKQGIPTLRLEVQTLGLDDAAKELAKFDDAFKAVKDSLSPLALEELEQARKDLSDALSDKAAGEGALRTRDRLKDLEKSIIDIQDTIRKSEIGELAVKFDQLGRSLDEAFKDAPAGGGAALLLETFKRLRTSLAELEIEKVADDLQKLRDGLDNIGRSTAETKIEALEKGFEKFAKALESRGLVNANDLLKRMRKNISDLQSTLAKAELDATLRRFGEAIQNAKFESDQLSKTPLRKELALIGREFDEAREKAAAVSRTLLRQAVSAGANAKALIELGNAAVEAKTKLDNLETDARGQALEDDRLAGVERSTQDLADSVGRNVGDGLISAFARGERASKAFSGVLSGFVEDALNKAIQSAVDLLQKGLEKAFNSLNLTGDAGGLIGGILGIASAIALAVKSKSSATVDDFSSAISSSEAVRGVVAGPSNVAIAKVGDSLKEALRTTEVLLEQILQSISGSALGVGGSPGVSLQGNAALDLSTSTQS